MSEETLFHQAMAHPASERAAFLDAACAGQPQLRAAVEALLAAHEASGSLLNRPPAAPGQTVDSGPAPEEPVATGEHIPAPVATTHYHPAVEPGLVIGGRYTLVEKIGEGGMGEVWVAKQTEPVKRRVALKLIKTGMDSKAVLARFEQERQALALMDHPNIARVFDGGLTPGGRPFFVMELVNGLPLTKFCDEARLPPKERLELFVPICQAVQHAHQKGIVHRDLKPANILVTVIDGKGVPKIIDFGVAKATAGKLTDESLSTQFGAVVGTLEYMAPEQAGLSGDDIDTRADIYSLGVILYELLTGLRPIDAKRLKQAALTEMIRILQEEEPSRPSTRLSTEESLPSLAALRQTEPKKLMALLRGELDWVVMKCLEKQRDRRYETASSLGRDIQRYLADEPVEARPPSAGYRLGKFLRRNKGAVLAAGLVLLALLGGIIGTTYGMLRAEQRRIEADEARAREAERAEGERLAKERETEQRARAEKARDRTRQALDDMTSSVTGESLATQKTISEEQKKFLKEVLTYYQEFAGEKADDAASRARTALAAARVGIIEVRLGRKVEATAAYRQALEGFTRLAAEFPAEPRYRHSLARTQNNLGLLLAGLGKETEALELFRQAQAAQEKLAAEFPTVLMYREELAGSHNNQGPALSGLGKPEEALEQFRQALTIREKLVAEAPDTLEYREQLAGIHTNVGSLLAEMGKGAEAQEHFQQAQSLFEKLTAAFPAVPAYRHHLATSQHKQADLLASLGKRAEAAKLYSQALALQEKLAAEFPAVPEYRGAVAHNQLRLGGMLFFLQQSAAASEHLQQARVMLEKLTAEFPAEPAYRHDLADTHSDLGNLLANLGNAAEAEAHYRKAVALHQQLAAEFPGLPAFRKAIAHDHANLGLLLAGLGKPAEAGEQYRQALALQEKLLAEFPAAADCLQTYAGTHNNFGLLLAGMEKWTEAEQHYRQALSGQEKLARLFPAVPQYQIELGGGYCNLGNLLRDSGKAGASLEWFNKAIAVLTPVYDQDRRFPTPRLFLRNSHLGRAMAKDLLGKSAEAIRDWDRAVELSPAPEQGGMRANRALSLLEAGQVKEAVAEVAELTKTSNWAPEYWYAFAGVYATASNKSPEKKQQYADRAMELLRQAVKAGFRNAAILKKDGNLNPLRGREDFKKLLQELEK
jgi:tetratricopeptide (TPR) repeat protein/tRNA A-37 threonylcarbamoyl transferase component Bud32